LLLSAILQDGFIIVSVLSCWQLEKAPSPILDTEEGTVISRRLVQPAKARSPMLFTVSGIETEESPEQP
jgi:hypothetical protein